MDSRERSRATAVLGITILSVLPVASRPSPVPTPRRIAVRVDEGFPAGPELERILGWAKRRGLQVETGPEASGAPKGSEVLHLSTLPPSERLKPLLARFPVSFEGSGFRFDGRTYSDGGAAIFLMDPRAPGEAFALGTEAKAVIGVAARRLLSNEGERWDYEVASGELGKKGRFLVQDGHLAIDRSADIDRIAAREAFFQALGEEKRGVIAWEFRPSERPAAARWEKVAARFGAKRSFSIRVFPDAATKALYAGSSRPADLVGDSGKVRVEIDASAPEEPDLVSPVLAAAPLAASDPRLLERRTLLLAEGARRFGRWWGRDVRSFAAFARAAGVEPSVGDVLGSGEDVSPVLAVGAAASWLDAGVRLEGEGAVDRALGDAEGALRGKLSRWQDAASRQSVRPPARRALPPGFLRGVSYAMTNSVEDAYVSPTSLATLKRIRDISANSVSVMPYAFSRGTKAEQVFFVHHSPHGETDEGTVRAVSDARSLGMTAMVKPQLWVGGGAFVGEIAMADEPSWRAWFDSYRRFIVHQAVVAEAAGADLFCVGTELKGTEEREKDWRGLIAAVRLATGAPLIYAANWAANAPRTPFWDAVDAIGVDFYDSPSKAEKPSDAILEQGVRQAARPLAELSRKFGKPVVFAEAGYPRVRAAWIAPHDEDSGRPLGGEDAARAIAAVYRALGKEDWWKGVYWWKVFSDGRPAPAGERGFNFLGTPAEKAIREGFERMR